MKKFMLLTESLLFAKSGCELVQNGKFNVVKRKLTAVGYLLHQKERKK